MKLWKVNTFLIIISVLLHINCELLNKNLTSSNNIIFSEKSSRKAKTEKKNNIKYTLDTKPNKFLDRKLIKKNSLYKKCETKTGVLLNVINHPKKKESRIQVTPTFVNLNLVSISIFKSFNKGLMHSIKLDTIQRITQHYEGTFCFSIIVNNVSDNELNIMPFTICAQSKKEMTDWVNTLLEFKHCKLSKVKNHPVGKVIIDFNSTNVYGKKQGIKYGINSRNGRGSYSKGSYAGSHGGSKGGSYGGYYAGSYGSRGPRGNGLNGVPSMAEGNQNLLYYDNVKKANVKTKEEKNNIEKVHKSVNMIVNTIKKGNIAHQKTKRIYKNKLIEAKKFTEHVLKKEEKIKEMLKNHHALQKNKEDQLIKVQNESKEMKILKETEKKLMKLKKEEIERSKMEYESKIKAEKEKANQRTKEMMRTIVEQDKLQDHTPCISHNVYSTLFIYIRL